MKTEKNPLPVWRRGDFLLLACVLPAALLLLGSILLFGGKGEQAVVTVDDRVLGRYDLSHDLQVDIPDKDGRITNRLVIQSGEASIEWADCPDQICVRHAPISRGGQSIVCLPNRVTVEIKGGDSLDGVAG